MAQDFSETLYAFPCTSFSRGGNEFITKQTVFHVKNDIVLVIYNKEKYDPKINN